MAQGWDKANKVTHKPTFTCDWCGEHSDDLRTIHYTGTSPIEINDHQAVCHDCAVERIPDTWEGCTCGGPLDGVNF